jgi:shikimate dehydrogenase
MTDRERRRLLIGLIGSHIQASRTPALQEREAGEHGIRCLYQLIDLEKLGLAQGALPDLLTAAERTGFDGLNITHPCKQAVLPLLTELSENAQALGAVNTVLLREGRRIGHNTDWRAFERSFRHGLPGARLDRVVQLGAGGAGAATAYAALKMGAGQITVIDQDSTRSEALAARCNGVFGSGRVQAGGDVASALSIADGLIHATPTGMLGKPGLPLAAAMLRRDLWVADVVYYPLATALLLAAKNLGCRTLDGGGMAVEQAAEAFRLFTGIEADRIRMRRHFLSMVQPG